MEELKPAYLNSQTAILVAFVKKFATEELAIYKMALEIREKTDNLYDSHIEVDDLKRLTVIRASALSGFQLTFLAKNIGILEELLKFCEKEVLEDEDLVKILQVSFDFFLGLKPKSMDDVNRSISAIEKKEKGYLIICTKPFEARWTWHLGDEMKKHLDLP